MSLFFCWKNLNEVTHRFYLIDWKTHLEQMCRKLPFRRKIDKNINQYLAKQLIGKLTERRTANLIPTYYIKRIHEYLWKIHTQHSYLHFCIGKLSTTHLGIQKHRIDNNIYLRNPHWFVNGLKSERTWVSAHEIGFFVNYLWEGRE